jgi:hypothetical protein
MLIPEDYWLKPVRIAIAKAGECLLQVMKMAHNTISIL